MAKVLGVGGVFFKSSDPRRLAKWYSKYLGMKPGPGGVVSFQPGDMPEGGATVWGVFPRTTRYFRPSAKPYMINLVVDDLERVLQQVQQGGGRIVGDVKEYPFGRFGSFLDPERNKVELWQPPRRGRRGASKN